MEYENIKEVSDKTINGVRRRVIINYPRLSGGKACGRINRFIGDIIIQIKKDAEKASFAYVRLTYKIKSEYPYSFLFETEKYGAGGVYSYIPFSVSFDEDGYALICRADKKTVKEMRRKFKERGIKISSRELKYSFYINDGKTVFYGAPRPDGRAKKVITAFEASASGRLFRKI